MYVHVSVCVSSLLQDHMMLKAAETSGMMHLVSERILQEHQTAVRKIQDDMERYVRTALLRAIAAQRVYWS